MFPRPPTSTLFPYTTLFRSYLVADLDPVQILLLVHLARDGPPVARQHGNRRRGRVDGLHCHHRHAVGADGEDRKSTRLNSSHLGISYAVFCLKKKKQI